MKGIFQLLACSFLLIACNNSADNRGAAEKTRADSLMDEVMEGHNKGMAKASRIHETKNKIQHVIDSISQLPTSIQKTSVQYRMQLDSTFNWLTFADNAMNKWMEEFNMDTLKDNEEQRIKYLESEKSKIGKVNEALIGSLQKADSLLRNKINNH